MNSRHVNRDCYGEPGYGRWLENCVANFRRILSAPDERYPNGRMSHDVAREQFNAYTDALGDYRVERGQWYADGSFAGYRESAV